MVYQFFKIPQPELINQALLNLSKLCLPSPGLLRNLRHNERLESAGPSWGTILRQTQIRHEVRLALRGNSEVNVTWSPREDSLALKFSKPKVEYSTCLSFRQCDGRSMVPGEGSAGYSGGGQGALRLELSEWRASAQVHTKLYPAAQVPLEQLLECGIDEETYRFWVSLTDRPKDKF